MVHRTSTTALNNMPAASASPYTPNFSGPADLTQFLSGEGGKDGEGKIPFGKGEEWTVTQFETTPPMSSYLVAFANGPFEYIEDSYTSPLSGKVRPLRVYSAYRLSLPQTGKSNLR